MANLAITLGDVLVNAKGGKFCPLKDAEGRPPTWTSDWLRIIWHPSAYGEPEARRVNLCVEPDDAAREHFEAVERKLAQELSSKSIHDPKIFGKLLVASEVEARLQSCLKTGQRGSSFLKLKLNWGRAHFWDVEGQPIEDPGDLSGRECRLSVELRQVWLMNPQCGLLLEVRDVQLREREPSAAACPFK